MRLLVLALSALSLGVASPDEASQALLRPTWTIAVSGLELGFFGGLLEAHGIELEGIEQGSISSPTAQTATGTLLFAFDPERGVELDAAAIEAPGFQLRNGPALADFAPLRLGLDRAGSLSLEGQGGLEIHTANPHLGFVAGRAVVRNLDLIVGRELAVALAKPQLEGLVLGLLHLELREPELELIGPSDRLDGRVDLVLEALRFPQQVRRLDELGKISITFATDITNHGSGDADWYWSLPPSPAFAPVIGPHPYAFFNVYRLSSGVLEQIARSDLKHAFFATNQGCACSGGQVLCASRGGQICRDFYSNANNTNQAHFAPKSEVDPRDGSWTALGSHFDGDPVDGIRDHEGEDDGFTHLGQIEIEALLLSDARYFLEACYLAPFDGEILDNYAWREVAVSELDEVFNFDFVGETRSEPAAFGLAEASVVVEAEDGRFLVSRFPDRALDGGTRSVWSILNLDHRHPPTAIELRLEGSSPGAAELRDGSSDPDWSAQITGGQVRFEPDQDAPSLEFGTTFTLVIDGDAPASGVLHLELGGTSLDALLP